MQNAVHFVGFPDPRRGKPTADYIRAVAIFGPPDFIHVCWDARAKAEIFPGDVAVFAKGDQDSPITPYTFDDSAVM